MDTRKKKIIVSGCLAGLPCSHDGRSRERAKIRALVESGQAIPVCPEQLGGRPTPRETTELAGGDGKAVLAGRARAVTREGRDVTAGFVKGAERVLAIARRHGCQQAVLKARSPSCGRGEIYDGSFSGRRVAGDGVTAALLAGEGLTVITDESF